MFSMIRSLFGGNSVKTKAKSCVKHRMLGSAPGLESLEARVVPTAVTENQVANLYRALLDRAPEGPALAAWSRSLESGRISVESMAERILQSPEYANRVVTQSFEGYLDRSPKSFGLVSYSGALQRGLGQERLNAGILGSNEYFARNGSDNTLFVKALYQDVLGRDADEAGLNAHVGELSKGATRTQVAYAILTSVESGEQLAGRAIGRFLVVRGPLESCPHGQEC